MFGMCCESVLDTEVFRVVQINVNQMTHAQKVYCALWCTRAPFKPERFIRWVPHKHYTLCDVNFRIHNACKRNWKILSMQGRISNFHGHAANNLSIVSASLKVQWPDVVTTVALCAGVWTSSTYDWRHGSWFFLTSQRYMVQCVICVYSHHIYYAYVYFQFLLFHQCSFCLYWWVHYFKLSSCRAAVWPFQPVFSN